jgi:TetR/AcrR family transcriptional regulator, fatty acid metabolism regulator protein
MEEILARLINDRDNTSDTKQKLLQVSKDLITRKGFRNVAISDICRKCDVAKGTFYIYFESKRDIVMEILNDLTIEFLHDFNWNDNLSANELLYDFHTKYMELVVKSGVNFTRECFICIIEQVVYGKVDKFAHQYIFERIIKHGINRGEYTDLKIEIYSRNYMLMIYSLFIDWCSNDGQYNIVEKGQTWIGYLIKDLQIYKYD